MCVCVCVCVCDWERRGTFIWLSCWCILLLQINICKIHSLTWLSFIFYVSCNLLNSKPLYTLALWIMNVLRMYVTTQYFCRTYFLSNSVRRKVCDLDSVHWLHFRFPNPVELWKISLMTVFIVQIAIDSILLRNICKFKLSLQPRWWFSFVSIGLIIYNMFSHYYVLVVIDELLR